MGDNLTTVTITALWNCILGGFELEVFRHFGTRLELVLCSSPELCVYPPCNGMRRGTSVVPYKCFQISLSIYLPIYQSLSICTQSCSSQFCVCCSNVRGLLLPAVVLSRAFAHNTLSQLWEDVFFLTWDLQKGVLDIRNIANVLLLLHTHIGKRFPWVVLGCRWQWLSLSACEVYVFKCECADVKVNLISWI